MKTESIGYRIRIKSTQDSISRLILATIKTGAVVEQLPNGRKIHIDPAKMSEFIGYFTGAVVEEINL